MLHLLRHPVSNLHSTSKTSANRLIPGSHGDSCAEGTGFARAARERITKPQRDAPLRHATCELEVHGNYLRIEEFEALMRIEPARIDNPKDKRMIILNPLLQE